MLRGTGKLLLPREFRSKEVPQVAILTEMHLTKKEDGDLVIFSIQNLATDRSGGAIILLRTGTPCEEISPPSPLVFNQPIST